MIVEGEGRAHVARSLGVDPATLRRLLMKGDAQRLEREDSGSRERVRLGFPA
jgi:hypothetical protein